MNWIRTFSLDDSLEGAIALGIGGPLPKIQTLLCSSLMTIFIYKRYATLR